jgi:hypothetical protein
LQSFVIGEATAAKQGGEAGFWHRQIQDDSKLKRDWHQEAIKIVERDAVDGCGFTSTMEAVRPCDVRHVGDHASRSPFADPSASDQRLDRPLNERS